VGLNSLKSLNLTNVYPNNKNKSKKKKNNKLKSKPLELRSWVKNLMKNFQTILRGGGGVRGAMHMYNKSAVGCDNN
jgi:hypothetical protein